MPIYEFDCPHGCPPFERLVRSAAAVAEVTCPACGSREVTRRLSTFAATGQGGPDCSKAASCAMASG